MAWLFYYGGTTVARRLNIQKFGFLTDDHFIFSPQEFLLAMECLRVLKIGFHYTTGNTFIHTFKNRCNLQFKIGPQGAKPGDWENVHFWHDNLPVSGMVFGFIESNWFPFFLKTGVGCRSQHSGLESFPTDAWRFGHHLIPRKFWWFKTGQQHRSQYYTPMTVSKLRLANPHRT